MIQPGDPVGPQREEGESTPPAAAWIPRGVKLALQLALTGIVTWFILRAVDFNLDELRAFDLSTLNLDSGIITLSSFVLLMSYLYSGALWGLMVKELSLIHI